MSASLGTAESLRGICVIGRSDFNTGIGTVTAAAAELLARTYHVTLCTPRMPGEGAVQLPSGRYVPLTTRPEGYAAYVFTDVLWNGALDFNYHSVPDHGLRVAHMAYDSDRLPDEWVRILNERFDLALFSSEYLVGVARASGVTIPVGSLPIGLELEPLLATRYRRPLPQVTRMGAVSAFHARKNQDLLVEGFIRAFGNDPSVDLTIHSNLAFGDVYERVQAMVASAAVTNIHLVHNDLTTADKDRLIAGLDVYVNVSAGEGYSIGPREALALGKPLVLSRIPAHDELQGVPGVFPVEPIGYQPAAYPEIDDRIMGRQALFDADSIAVALQQAREFAVSPDAAATVGERRRSAARFSYTSLASSYAAVIDPDSRIESAAPVSEYLSVPAPAVERARAAGGAHGWRLGGRRLVVPAHDGGFFSIFNTFMTHLVWGTIDREYTMVLPDWRVDSLIERSKNDPIESFCYGQPEDGNIWTSLFEPLFGLTRDQLDDPGFLSTNAETPRLLHNERNEPNLTYTNAYKLYIDPDFIRFRRQYHGALERHVRLLPHYRAEIDAFVDDTIAGRFTIGVHVKHPSHAIEQASGSMADRFEYVDRVRRELRTRGISANSDDWAVFVATDQERVRNLFQDEFGDHVVGFDDVARSPEATDVRFDQLPDNERLRSGHQFQHQMAADRSNWSTRLAWEVWRDAEALAASDVVVHAVSNVATAVSYLNPDNVMRSYDG